ncbi:MAG: HPF/RaiA family ribosome-associated protein [Rhodoferax sp.]|jgi:ribosome-associated translation inhibitor RaiA
MQIQVNTDHNIEGHAAMTTWATSEVHNAVNRFAEHITRIEVHLSDENGSKNGPRDMRCLIEARHEGRPPVAVTEHADNLHQAVTGAAHKLARLMESSLGRAARPVAAPEGAPETEPPQ